jgi:hypothetical protein
MELNLKYRPSIDTIPLFASDIVKSARKVSHVTLDYTASSLHDVDAIVQSFVDDGLPVEAIGETLFGFGCYVGEVFVRTASGVWKHIADDDRLLELMGWAFVVALPGDSVCNPIGKVFKRLELGESENLPYFYSVFARRRPPRPTFLNRLRRRSRE